MSRKGCRWSVEEENKIYKMYIEDNIKISDIAKQVERSNKAISCKLKDLGVLKDEDNEITQLKTEILELKKTVNEVLEMMKAVYQYETQ
jgi:transposase-like protein